MCVCVCMCVGIYIYCIYLSAQLLTPSYEGYLPRPLTPVLPMTWPLQDIVLFRGVCARINHTFCEQHLCLGTPLPSFIAHTIAQYIVLPRPPLTAIIYHTILSMAISCKDQPMTYPVPFMYGTIRVNHPFLPPSPPPTLPPSLPPRVQG